MSEPQTQPYAHLVSEDLPGSPEVASCVYHDGLPAEGRFLDILDLVEGWFAAFSSKPRVVLTKTRAGNSPRHTLKSLRSAATHDDAAFMRDVRTVQFFPKGRSTVDDTWRPSVYATVSFERPASAFFCVNQSLPATALLRQIQSGEQCFSASASYGFWFPQQFSPLGYFWGITVQPARRYGNWTSRHARRLSHWRDNAQIGLCDKGTRRYFSAGDGFVRDVYPLMLLSETHLARRAAGIPLRDRIAKEGLGDIEPLGSKLLWHVPHRSLVTIQSLLDENDVTLSGRRLEHVAGPAAWH